MKKIKFLISLLMLPVALLAQVEVVFNNVKMEESLESVTEKMGEISESFEVINVEVPTFPLAAESEAHLVCSNIRTSEGLIEKVVFTFADDQLKYMLSKGNVFPVFKEKRKDTAMVYMGYEVYFSDKLFLHKEKDLAWVLSQDALHPNLFVWENPYLENNIAGVNANDSNLVPSFLKMGGNIDELKPILEENSDFIAVEQLDGKDPNAQTQINCFGVDYAGFPRKVEARFGDGKLNVVWILTGKAEEDRIRKALVNQYGAPIFENEDWEIYNDWQVGLRKDKPEVLLMEKSIGQQYKSSYFKQ